MLLAVTAALAAADVCDNWQPPELVVVDDIGAGVAESSGLVYVDGEFRTIGDAGGEPVLYTFGADGSARGEQRIDGATNTDWEDLAAGPCSIDSEKTCIFIADIGDNDDSRDSIILWRLAVSSEAREEATACKLTYPEGKAHDAEALLMFPDGTVRIVTKENDGVAKVFRAGQVDCEGTTALSEEVEIDLGEAVTGGAVGADGTLVALRSLERAWVWRGCTLDWATIPDPIELTGEEQGEGICFGESDALFTTSEGDPLEMHALACDTAAALECPACGCQGGNTPAGLVAALAAAGMLGGRRRDQTRKGSGRSRSHSPSLRGLRGSQTHR